jgi:hypothetical protein
MAESVSMAGSSVEAVPDDSAGTERSPLISSTRSSDTPAMRSTNEFPVIDASI